MLNLNTNNDYSMAFSHHLTTGDQQFYHNLYTNPPATSIKEKNEFLYKNQKFDFINNNAAGSVGSEMFTSTKDCENSKRFSVNNLLKPPPEPTVEKINGEYWRIRTNWET